MGTIAIAKFGNTAIAAYGDSRMERETIANYKKRVHSEFEYTSVPEKSNGCSHKRIHRNMC